MDYRQSTLLLALLIGVARCVPTDPPVDWVPRSVIVIFDQPRQRDSALQSARMRFLNDGLKNVLGKAADATHFPVGSSQVMLIKNATDSELEKLKASVADLQGIVDDNTEYRIDLPSKPTIVSVDKLSSKAASSRDATTCVSRTLQHSTYTHDLDLLDLHDGDGSYCSPASSTTKMDVFTLDTGIEKTHDDFIGLEISTDDANDGTVRGQWTPLVDKDGHGTHVAGIIASNLFGVTPNVIFHSIKVLNDVGTGSSSTIIGGLRILENWLKSNPTKKAVVNMSVGGPRNSALESTLTAIATQYGDRVVFAVAAGNEAVPACNTNLPSVAQAVTVGSVSQSLWESSFSNYGSCVDVFSEGESIVSSYKNNQHAVLSGTSMATPVVAGVLTQYWLQNPGMTGVAVRNTILNLAESDIHAKGQLHGLSSGSPDKLIRYTCPGGCGGTFSPCASGPCLNGGTCSSSLSGFTCTCLSGISGDRCQTTSAPCSSSPCQNGGLCFGLTNGYGCVCRSGFNGVNCESPSSSPCTSNPCLNGGTCSNSLSGFTCTCPLGISGDRCQTTGAPCSSSPCQNGGLCFGLTNGYSCVCPSGYNGVNCETPSSSPCTSNPCLNGGTCTSSLSGFTCTCPSGIIGDRCQMTSAPCSSSPCQNGGICFGLTGGYACVCRSGYSGVSCQTSAFNPCTSNPCLNGGTCRQAASSSSYTCSCPSGFTGSRCESRIANPCYLGACANGGTCVPLGSGIRCTCSSGYGGDRCKLRCYWIFCF